MNKLLCLTILLAINCAIGEEQHSFKGYKTRFLILKKIEVIH
jgi:hypothetical protein